MKQALYVVYHQPSKKELLTELLVPLALNLQSKEGVRHVHLERHWKHGPHVRLVLDTDHKDLIIEAQSLVRDHLQTAPSAQPLDADRYLKEAEKLGTLEVEPGPYLPLWPDNTVHIGEAPDRSALLGNAQTQTLRDRYMHSLLKPVHATLQQLKAQPRMKIPLVVQILTLNAALYPHGLFSGHLSYRSHLEEHLFHAGETVREGFAQRHAPHRDWFIEQVRDVQNGELSEVLQLWKDHFEQMWEEALPLARAGFLHDESSLFIRAVAEQVNPEAVSRWEFTDERAYSPFHTRLRQFNFLPERANVEEFSIYRTLTNFLYSSLTLLDVSPTERYFSNFVIGESIEALFNRRWQDHFDAWWAAHHSPLEMAPQEVK